MAKTPVFTISLLFFLLFISNFMANAIPGGLSKIRDVENNKEVQELGRYSVEEHNRLERSKKDGAGDLKFSKVVAAEEQVVAGIMYYLQIEAVSKSGDSKVFQAEVWVREWLHSKQLVSFKPSPAKN